MHIKKNIIIILFFFGWWCFIDPIFKKILLCTYINNSYNRFKTLKEIKKLLPHEDFIYYADAKNNPYGNKTDEALYLIVDNIVKKLISKDVKLIVIACNTATTKCIAKLRENYPNMLFIGTEPAIKVACDNNYKNTLVLATTGTIESERTQELVLNNKKEDQNIYLLACEGLANAIEESNQARINELLHK